MVGCTYIKICWLIIGFISLFSGLSFAQDITQESEKSVQDDKNSSQIKKSKKKRKKKRRSVFEFDVDTGFDPELSSLKLDKTALQMSSYLTHARILFRRKDFLGALLVLKAQDNQVKSQEILLENKNLEKKPDLAIVQEESKFLSAAQEKFDSLWIRGESFFQLKRYGESEKVFQEIVNSSRDPIDIRKALIRVFDSKLLGGDTQGAVNSYLAYKKQFKKPTAKMSYNLGNILFNLGYEDRAAKILKSIPKKSEFFLRARFIIALWGMKTKSYKVSVKNFSFIEKQAPRCVEDHSVRWMAQLAQIRILAENQRLKIAQKVFDRMKLNTSYGRSATAELARAYLDIADLARHKQGKYKKVFTAAREVIESENIGKALDIIMRYRKHREISWRTPELHEVMAYAFVRSRRYEEARLAYAELLGHYRGLYADLNSSEETNNNQEIWPVFRLREYPDLSKSYSHNLILGIPEVFFHNIVEIAQIKKLKFHIESHGVKLRELEQSSRYFKLTQTKENLVQIRVNQDALERAYENMVRIKQQEIIKLVAENLNTSLARAEFERAHLAWFEMQDLDKKTDAVRTFQKDAVDNFEKTVRELDKKKDTKKNKDSSS